MKNINVRKVLVILTVLVMTTTAAFAALYWPKSTSAPILNDTIQVNFQGKDVDFGQYKVYIDDGRTYVPYRQFFESIGYEVKWDQTTKTASAIDPLRISSSVDREQKVDAALWQLSAEARACFWQSFNLAPLRYDQAVAEKKEGEKLAVIADIDDTLVDGVMYTADVLQDGEWTNTAFGASLASDACLPLPGAVEFMNYVVDKGGTVFYITNRDPSLMEVTYSSMKEMGFPMIDEKHIFIRETGMASSKKKIIRLYWCLGIIWKISPTFFL